MIRMSLFSRARSTSLATTLRSAPLATMMRRDAHLVGLRRRRRRRTEPAVKESAVPRRKHTGGTNGGGWRQGRQLAAALAGTSGAGTAVRGAHRDRHRRHRGRGTATGTGGGAGTSCHGHRRRRRAPAAPPAPAAPRAPAPAAPAGSAAPPVRPNGTACTLSRHRPRRLHQRHLQRLHRRQRLLGDRRLRHRLHLSVGNWRLRPGHLSQQRRLQREDLQRSHTCTACTTAADCSAAYGTGYICQTATGTCVAGHLRHERRLRHRPDLQRQLAQCVELRHQRRRLRHRLRHRLHLRLRRCVTGTCHTGADCTTTAGQICNASHTCANCTDDDDELPDQLHRRPHLRRHHLRRRATAGATPTAATARSASTTAASTARSDTELRLGPGLPLGRLHDGQLPRRDRLHTTRPRSAPTTAAAPAPSTATASPPAPTARTTSAAPVSCIAGNCRVEGRLRRDRPDLRRADAALLRRLRRATPTPTARPSTAPTTSASAASASPATATHSTGCATGQVCDLAAHSCAGCGSGRAVRRDLPGRLRHGSTYICQSERLHHRQVPHRRRAATTRRKVCNSLTCGMCSTNADCTNAYGANHVCSGGACVSGNCNSSADCGSNQLCVEPHLRRLHGRRDR